MLILLFWPFFLLMAAVVLWSVAWPLIVVLFVIWMVVGIVKFLMK